MKNAACQGALGDDEYNKKRGWCDREMGKGDDEEDDALVQQAAAASRWRGLDDFVVHCWMVMTREEKKVVQILSSPRHFFP